MVAFSLKPATVASSVLAPYVLMGARVVGAALPQDLSAAFNWARQVQKSSDREGQKGAGK